MTRAVCRSKLKNLQLIMSCANWRNAQRRIGLAMLAQSGTMPNIASVLKTEISRVARKESRVETQALKKASTQHRSDIAELKRQVHMLEKKIRVLAKSAAPASAAPAAAQSDHRAYRFSARRLAAHRSRL